MCLYFSNRSILQAGDKQCARVLAFRRGFPNPRTAKRDDPFNTIRYPHIYIYTSYNAGSDSFLTLRRPCVFYQVLCRRLSEINGKLPVGYHGVVVASVYPYRRYSRKKKLYTRQYSYLCFTGEKKRIVSIKQFVMNYEFIQISIFIFSKQIGRRV